MSWHGPHVGPLFHPSEGHSEALMKAGEVGVDLPQAHLCAWWSWPMIIASGARTPCGTLTGSWHRKEQEVKDIYHEPAWKSRVVSVDVPGLCITVGPSQENEQSGVHRWKS